MNADTKTMLAQGLGKIKTFVKWSALIAGVAFVVLVVFLYTQERHYKVQQQAQQRAVQEWNWNHYTGWRITRDLYNWRDVTGYHPPSDKPRLSLWCQNNQCVEHGIWEDKKTGEECTDKGYPGYPPCPAQEYVADGKPAPEPPIDLSAGMVPKQEFDPSAPYQNVKKPKHVPHKTGTVQYASVLYVDACAHPSNKTIPAGSKIKILGRFPIGWYGGCMTSQDLVKVSFDGVVGWVSDYSVLEDIAAPSETKEEKVEKDDCVALRMTCKS
jgi:hypothetical protein